MNANEHASGYGKFPPPPKLSPARAIVLVSGGLDSSTILALAAAKSRMIYALSFDYGQRHAIELAAAKRQAAHHGSAAHQIIDLRQLAPLVADVSALVRDSNLPIPKDRDIGRADQVPSTYVPARNTLFLSYALAWAEAIGAHEIWIGANAVDYSGYPDCRGEFFEAFENAANLGTRFEEQGPRLKLITPLLHLPKHEIIALGTSHGVDYADTVSCYDPTTVDGQRALACRRCDSCRLRRRGFERSGVPDPTNYI
ncbi:MAG: 7-cyano-7-deazaguanine synthase QueC [Nannocystaceae bacterium]